MYLHVKMFSPLPDAGLGEPGLVSQRRHSCVHEGVRLNKLQGVIRELDGALKGRSWTVTRARTGSRMEGARTHIEGKRSEIGP